MGHTMNERTKELLAVLRDRASFLLNNPDLHPDGDPEYIKLIANELEKANKGDDNQ